MWVQPWLLRLDIIQGEVRYDGMQHHDSGVKRVEIVRALLMSFNVDSRLREGETGAPAPTKPNLCIGHDAPS